jgi:5-methylcytosine-specific restriction endonuclease McrA
MTMALFPSSLDSATLTRRLGELAGDERNVQVDFLLHLDEFDRRRAYLDANHGSLWDYCLRALHLREGAAGRRIGAMRVLRRFPRLEAALRDGRLCASTAALLSQVLTDQNLEDLVARAAYRTKVEVEEIVVSLRPRPVPQEGIRKLATAAPSARARKEHNQSAPAGDLLELVSPAPTASPPAPTRAEVAREDASRASPPRVEPVAEDRWSVRVTLDADAKEELETLKALLSHKIPSGELGAVLREAIRCGIEKHGKRKGAIPAGRKVSADARARSDDQVDSGQPASTHVPAAVRRAVWKRDGGRCTFVGPDGRRCDSRWQLEFDHIVPPALGGTSEADNIRLRCRGHNMLHAERTYGREHMDRFRKAASTIAGDSSSTVVVSSARREARTGSAPQTNGRAAPRRASTPGGQGNRKEA